MCNLINTHTHTHTHTHCSKLHMQYTLYRICNVLYTANECFYDSPPPCQRRFQNRFYAFSPSSFFFLLVRPGHVDVIVNTSLSCILFFNLAACSDKYLFISLGGGGLSLKHSNIIPVCSIFCAAISVILFIYMYLLIPVFLFPWSNGAKLLSSQKNQRVSDCVSFIFLLSFASLNRECWTNSWRVVS